MAKIEEMSKKQIEAMFKDRIEKAMILEEINKKYPGVFCGCELFPDSVLHIYHVEDFKNIARILGKKFAKNSEKKILQCLETFFKICHRYCRGFYDFCRFRNGYGGGKCSALGFRLL